MKIQQALQDEHSLELSKKIARYIGKDPSRFDELMIVFFSGEAPLPQRAAWAMAHACEAHPELVLPYTSRLIRQLQQPGHHDGVIRNTLRVFEDIELPEEDCGAMLDLGLGYIRSEKQPSAIRAFAMTVVSNIALRYPELKPEIRMVIHEVMEAPEAAPAILSRGRKILRLLSK